MNEHALPGHVQDSMLLLGRLRMVAEAAIVSRHSAVGGTVSGSKQKLVLFQLVLQEGRPIKLTDLADRCGLGMVSTWRAIDAMVKLGFITRRGSKNKALEYLVDIRELMRLRDAA